MHELALAQSLVRMVVEEAERAQAHSVVTVALQLGALSHVEPSSLSLAFSAASRGTVAHGALLQIEHTLAQAHCLSCGADHSIERRGAGCPSCGAFSLVVVGGDELRLTRLEVL
ncbi:MAG TPA: hydrogenase maturation nickel metallochaperone HypA [Pseudomonadota bacterium]|nr:hydrogenase maturation nickel metallochaperone HypA [Pseudomonadota bacterium]HNN50701.1 hydrogenase maturation nickel metallochaperone HypA [Pseudomonadota bacterium]